MADKKNRQQNKDRAKDNRMKEQTEMLNRAQIDEEPKNPPKKSPDEKKEKETF